jgi:hypothetical protein
LYNSNKKYLQDRKSIQNYIKNRIQKQKIRRKRKTEKKMEQRLTRPHLAVAARQKPAEQPNNRKPSTAQTPAVPLRPK